ncbi:hypothetical protein CLOP_g1216 [Closterium sp. NIES-67]|nr:hypothetical protein CLOP_g1216 [Closterium sp. NIES-67]
MADTSAAPLPPVPPSPPIAPVCCPLTSLDQLLQWRPGSPATGGIYNRATAPFRARSVAGGAPRSGRRRQQRVLACHDMMGGYVEDQCAQGSARSDVYRMWEWDVVDAWVYFSHHLVTVPPVAWSNCCRTHGVQSLGTFITEWEQGAAVCRQLLASPATAALAAQQLAELAHWHGFHGWLVNIENKVEKASIPTLLHFLRALTHHMYDSVTEEGELKWQDALTPANQVFFHACDGIFTNYCWQGPAQVRASAVVAGARAADVFMGVDCFEAPGRAGRGFKAGQCVQTALEGGVSAAVFAPAWVYETWQGPCFEAAQERLWHGIRTALHLRRSLPSRHPLAAPLTQLSLHAQQGAHGDRAEGVQGADGAQGQGGGSEGGKAGERSESMGAGGEQGAVVGTAVCAGDLSGESSAAACEEEGESGFPISLPLFTAFDQGVGTTMWLAGRHVASSHWSNFSCQTLRPVHMHTSRPLLSARPPRPPCSVRCSLWQGTAWEGSAALLLSLSPSPSPSLVPDPSANQVLPRVQLGPATSACVVDVFRPRVHVEQDTILHVSYSVVSASGFITCLALSLHPVPGHPPHYHSPTTPTPPAHTAPHFPPHSTILLLPPPPLSPTPLSSHPSSHPHSLAPPSLSTPSPSPTTCLFPTVTRPSPSHLTPPTTKLGDSGAECGAGREQARGGSAVWEVREYQVPFEANHVLTGVHVLLVAVGHAALNAPVPGLPAGDAAGDRGCEHTPQVSMAKELLLTGGDTGTADWLMDVCKAAWLASTSLTSPIITRGGDGDGDGEKATGTGTGQPTAAPVGISPAASDAAGPGASSPESTEAPAAAEESPAHAALPCFLPAVLPPAAATAVGHVRVAAEPEPACLARWKVKGLCAEQVWWVQGKGKSSGGEGMGGREGEARTEVEEGRDGIEGSLEVEQKGGSRDGDEKGVDGGNEACFLSAVLNWVTDDGGTDCDSGSHTTPQQHQEEDTWKLCSEHGPMSCRYDVLAAFDWQGAGEVTGASGEQADGGPVLAESPSAAGGASLLDSPLAAQLTSLDWRWVGAAHAPSFVVDRLPLAPAAGAAAARAVVVVVRPRCLLCGAAPAVEQCPWLLLHRQ